MKEKIVGIIGGLGPEATVDLMRRVIQATPARDDQDHIRMIVDCNPKVPSRMKAILEGTGENPAPYLVTMAKDLAAWGADFLAIACNTAHLYLDRIQEAVPIPVLNMIDLTVDRVVSENPLIRKAGLLASWTVIRPGLYESAFEKRGVALLHPSPALQDRLLAAIRRIKTGHHGLPEREALEECREGTGGSGGRSPGHCLYGTLRDSGRTPDEVQRFRCLPGPGRSHSPGGEGRKHLTKTI